jgi:hypothetical protein
MYNQTCHNGNALASNPKAISSAGNSTIRKVTTKPDSMITTMRSAANKLHFQVLADSFVARKFSDLILSVDFGHQLPLKYFKYNPNTSHITTNDHGTGTKAKTITQATKPAMAKTK